jgi:hypothetical protein
LQLIEIVQLVLVGFAVIILLLLSVSYFGYKARKRKLSNSMSLHPESIKIDSNIFVKQSIPQTFPNKQKPTYSSTTNKFEVFNPKVDPDKNQNPIKTKKHFPRTLFIKY